jgi:hypothetical protein
MEMSPNKVRTIKIFSAMDAYMEPFKFTGEDLTTKWEKDYLTIYDRTVLTFRIQKEKCVIIVYDREGYENRN